MGLLLLGRVESRVIIVTGTEQRRGCCVVAAAVEAGDVLAKSGVGVEEVGWGD